MERFSLIEIDKLFKQFKSGFLNQFNWTYLADSGKRHHIGLLHGAQSGHLLVHCNNNIILIDFEVLEDSKYSLFIDDQLCEISIERKGEQFYYGFEINSKADTPRNRQIKKLEKKHMIQSMVFLGSLVLIILVVIFGVTRWSQKNDWEDISFKLKKMGLETNARILMASEEKTTDFANYFFMVDGKPYSIKTNFPTEKVVVLENGMPLEPGDEFVVTYVPDNPRLNKIDYNRPTQKQIAIYQQRAIARHLELNPNMDPIDAKCFVNVAFEIKGIGGLADLYFQKASVEENPQHNSNSFGRLVRDIPFQKEIKEHCDL